MTDRNDNNDDDNDDDNGKTANALYINGEPNTVSKETYVAHQMNITDELNATVSEIDSPPRVTALLPHGDLIPGSAMDITTVDEQGNPWDFDNHEQRAKARKRVEEEKPTILIGSPMCTAFSLLQQVNYAKMEPDRVRRILARARQQQRLSRRPCR